MPFFALIILNHGQFMCQLISEILEFVSPMNPYHDAVVVTRVNMENETENILGKQVLLPPF